MEGEFRDLQRDAKDFVEIILAAQRLKVSSELLVSVLQCYIEGLNAAKSAGGEKTVKLD